MSSKGIFTALSGATANNQKLETIANNIANVNTPAFKRDQQVFKEYLTSFEKAPDVIQVPKVPASVESFFDMQGADKSFVNVDGTYTDFTQGSLKATGNALDLGIEGKGFFEVLTPQGVKLTRNGNFSVDSTGRLVTKAGYPVLREGSGDPTQRFISLVEQPVTISTSGDVYQGGDLKGVLSLVDVEKPGESLQKFGNSLYSIKENYDVTLNREPEVVLHQGFTENSNVNVVQEMTDMINATRTFESTQQAIKAYDQIDDHLVNSVPRIG